jgi:ribose transport system substrate-binding protein
MTKRIFILLFILINIALFIGCGRRHETNESYALVTANKSIPYWQTAINGFESAAEQMKVKALISGPDNYDPNAEKEEFHKLLADKPSGILVSAADAASMKPEIDAANAQGIPVITFDTDAPDSNRLFFIGTNNYQAGITGGEIIARELKGKGNVVVFTMPNQLNLQERLQGYKNALEKTPGIKIVDTIDMKGDPRIVFDSVQSILDKKQPVDGFICLEAQGGKEVATVLSNSKVTGKTIVAMDTDDATLDWIKKGVIAATLGQKPYTMAYVGIKMLDDYHHSKTNMANPAAMKGPMSPLPSYVDTGSFVVDKNNVDQTIQSIQQSQKKK